MEILHKWYVGPSCITFYFQGFNRQYFSIARGNGAQPVTSQYQGAFSPMLLMHICIIRLRCVISAKCNTSSTQQLIVKNIERHTAHTIVSWPSPEQWVIVHTSDLMMIIRQSTYILSIITKDVVKLKTHNLTYCIMVNWENMLNLAHTLDKLYLTGILSNQCLQIKFAQWW